MNINDALDVPEWQRPQMFYGKPLTYHDGRHMYFWDGVHVPSVTTIIKRLDKPGLLWWAAEEAVKAMQRGESPEEARKAHVKVKDAAADIGNVLHDIAERIQSGKEPSADLTRKLPVEDQLIASNCALALKEWMGAQQFGDAELERKVFSKSMMYAGRCDRFGRINNRLAVLDFKSGGEKIYPETWLQMSAYELALQEEYGALDDVWHYAIHLNKKTGKCTPYIRGPEHTSWAKEAWRRLVDFDRCMRQVPTEAQMRKVA